MDGIPHFCDVLKFAPDGLNVWRETVRDPDFDKVISLLAIRGV